MPVRNTFFPTVSAAQAIGYPAPVVLPQGCAFVYSMNHNAARFNRNPLQVCGSLQGGPANTCEFTFTTTGLKKQGKPGKPMVQHDPLHVKPVFAHSWQLHHQSRVYVTRFAQENHGRK